MANDMIEITIAHCDGCDCDFAIGPDETVLNYVIDSPNFSGVYCLGCRAVGGLVDEALN